MEQSKLDPALRGLVRERGERDPDERLLVSVRIDPRAEAAQVDRVAALVEGDVRRGSPVVTGRILASALAALSEIPAVLTVRLSRKLAAL